MKPLTQPTAETDSLSPAPGPSPAGSPRIPGSGTLRQGRNRSLEDVFNEPEMDAERRKDVLAKAAFRLTAASTPSASPQGLPLSPADPGISARAHVRNPWAIWRVSDLFVQCGPLLTLYMAAQVASACITASWLAAHGVLDRALLTGMLILLFVTLDAMVFVCLRGRLLAGFLKPACWLAVATLIPGGLALAAAWFERIGPSV